jgi:hypothetical protein
MSVDQGGQKNRNGQTIVVLFTIFPTSEGRRTLNGPICSKIHF